MSSSKLLTLGGLGASATAAIAGPGATFTGGQSLPPPYNSTLIRGVSDNSTSLFQAFDLECVKKIFSGLENPDSIKQPISGSANTSSFALPSTASIGTVSGCFKIDLKHYKDTDRGNLAAKLEMAVTKGDYGIILLNSITNMLKNGGYGFLYRALFLKKEQSSNWQIKGGVEWQDTFFMDASKPEQTKWHLPQGKEIDGVFWRQNICALSEECEAKLKEKTNSGQEPTTYEWSTTSGKNVWQGLQIQATDSRASGYESDFWNDKETPIAESVSRIAASPNAIFMNDYWGRTSAPLFNRNEATFKNWFNIFKEDKGEWKAQAS